MSFVCEDGSAVEIFPGERDGMQREIPRIN